MPTKPKFSKEAIVDVAFTLAKKDGFSAITARNVAKELHSSVAPIYFNFKNIHDLLNAVVKRIFQITQDIFNDQESDSLYENMGRAGFIFAERYPVFFRELVLTPNPYISSYESIEDAMLKGLDEDPKASRLSLKSRKHLILKVKALQIGFQTLIANQQLPSFITKKEAQDMFINMGHQLMELEINDKGEPYGKDKNN